MIQPFSGYCYQNKPNIMVRLYGSLQFDNSETREKLEYILWLAMKRNKEYAERSDEYIL